MTVRPATSADRPQLLALIRGYFEFYATPFPEPAKINALLDTLQADGRLGIQLVAESDGRLVGFTSLYACVDTLVADRILVMNDLFVEPGSRGSGVGAALLDGARAYAAESGYARLDWVTAHDNLGAQRFYERHGGRRGDWISYSLPVS